MKIYQTALFTLLLGACGADPVETEIETDVIDLEGKDDSISRAKAALPPGATHIYFGTESRAAISDDDHLAYRWFTANAGSEFRVDVDSQDGAGVTTPAVHVGFKLQRAVKRSGRWSWSVVAQGESDEGRATIAYRPTSGPGLYLVTVTGSPLPLELAIHVDCGGTRCTTKLQPGESCGGRANRRACDEGTFCSYTIEARCGAADAPGTCAIEPSVCPRGIRYTPVCGCDGRTHDGVCGAAADGTSVQRTGPCEVNVVGAWGAVAPTGAHYDYTFEPDGSFTTTWQPACVFQNPRCFVKIAPATGHYGILGTNLHLSYDGPVRTGESATFAYSGRGARARLAGSDYGQALTLTRK